MRLKRLAIAIVGLLALGLVGPVATAEAAPTASRFRPVGIGQAGLTTTLRLLTLQDPTTPPPGVNDFGCQPSAAHPDPVVLLHGLGGNRYTNWAYLGPTLANRGYCVFALNYGGVTPTFPLQGTKPVAGSAPQINAFIDEVRAATGSDRVDVLGHSEGGFMSLYVPKVTDAGAKIDSVVALAPPSHGTDFGGLVPFADAFGLRPVVDTLLTAFGCGACRDLIVGGPGVTELNDGPIAQPGIRYTIIASTNDQVVTPPETSFVDEPGVTNQFVQDVCPSSRVGHVSLAYDSSVATMIGNALDPDNPQPVTCTQGAAF